MSSVGANRARIEADLEAARALLDRCGRKVGAAYKELAVLDGVGAGAAQFLQGTGAYANRGQYDDIQVARELRTALQRAEAAIREVKDAA